MFSKIHLASPYHASRSFSGKASLTDPQSHRTDFYRAFPALTVLKLGDTGIRDEEKGDEEQSGLPDPATKMQRCLGC